MAAAVGWSTRKTFLAPARSAEEMTALRSTVVMPDETEITTWGFTQWWRLWTRRMK